MQRSFARMHVAFRVVRILNAHAKGAFICSTGLGGGLLGKARVDGAEGCA